MSLNLNEQLVRLLRGHGVAASPENDAVVVEPTRATAVLSASRTNPNSLLLSIRATAPDGAVLTDLWAGLGREDGPATRDGLEAFCRGGFHVFLAAAWGVLEEDQVDHVELHTGGRHWDLYAGAVVGRASAGASLRVPPLWDALVPAIETALADLHASAVGRLYAHHLNTEMTFEALLNGEPHPGMEAFWKGLPWQPSDAGFASQRMLWIAIPRTGNGPAHSRVGRCEAS